MKIVSGVYWDQGGRSINQDSLTFQQVLTCQGRVALAVVSDGIGGLMRGEIASGFITEKLVENFYGQLVSLVGRRRGKRAIKNSLLRCFHSMNEELRRYGEREEFRLGATVSLLFVWKKRYMIFHLGDSRIYLCRKGRMKLLTEDHSAPDGGLLKCMGSFPFQYPAVSFGRLRKKSGFLLCTDGFYRTFGEEAPQVLAPEEVNREEQIERRLRELGRSAGRKGEQDNLSAIYLTTG